MNFIRIINIGLMAFSYCYEQIEENFFNFYLYNLDNCSNCISYTKWYFYNRWASQFCNGNFLSVPQSSSSNIQERPIGYAQVNFSQFVVLVFPGKNYPTRVIKDFSTNIIVNDRICLVSF